MKELLELLKKVRSDIDFEHETSMVTDELLESMDIMMIVTKLEEHYDITIDLETLVPENFESLESIFNMVNSIRNE